MTWLKWPGTGDAINLDRVQRYSIGTAGTGSASFVFSGLGGDSVTITGFAASDADAAAILDRLLHVEDPADYI